MSSAGDFLPGFYRNLPIEKHESLPGYLLRVAEANGYAGIAAVLKEVAGMRVQRPAAMVREVRTSRELLQTLGSAAVGDPSHLLHFYGVPMADEAMVLEGMRVDDDAWLSEGAQICPTCLIERGTALEAWDMACVTVCSQHSTVLSDVCPTCATEISWSRPSLFGCPGCGGDYRGIAPLAASGMAVTVSGDFEALARFRFSLLDGAVEIQSWDAGFRLFKCLNLTPSHWARAEFPGKYMRSSKLSARHTTTELLATIRKRNLYDLTSLVKATNSLLGPLRVIPKPYVLERYGQRLLMSEAGLSPSMAEALLTRQPMQKPAAGYELFHGRPPALYGLDAVVNFLGVDPLTVSALNRAKQLLRPTGGEPYDIDSVLGAQRYLRDELLTLPEQHAVLGVALTPGDPLTESLLKPWNSRNHADKRVPLGSVLDIHVSVLARWRDAPPLTHGISLGSIAVKTNHPASTVVRAVMLILNGTISNMDWVAPFRWADIRVEDSVAKTILAGAVLAAQMQ
jgi:hypothetical protein